MTGFHESLALIRISQDPSQHLGEPMRGFRLICIPAPVNADGVRRMNEAVPSHQRFDHVSPLAHGSEKASHQLSIHGYEHDRVFFYADLVTFLQGCLGLG